MHFYLPSVMSLIVPLVLFLPIYSAVKVNNLACNVRRLDDERTVCVCNAAYCDTVPRLQRFPLYNGKYQIYRTSRNNLGLNSEVNDLVLKKGFRLDQITINTTKVYQKIIGFGGALTDATGINIQSLPAKTKSKLIRSYFGGSGIGYTLVRVPIGGTDFSTRYYSYDDQKDDNSLSHFSLQPEDLNYKIPILQKVLKLSRCRTFRLFASAWTAPPWMKSNNAWAGQNGTLKPEYYQTWAHYHLKFLQSYQSKGIPFWGITTGNEPIQGYAPKNLTYLNNMAWSPMDMKKWIIGNLGPTIRNSPFRNTKIILHDDARITLPVLPMLLKYNSVLNYADGVGVHWYWKEFTPESFLNLARSDKKNLFLLGTEASIGADEDMGIPGVSLGNFERAKLYIEDIFQLLAFNGAGWMDYNMVLNEDGGPSFIKKQSDAPIIISKTGKEFYKQPMFYALGHFSKFVTPGSTRIQSMVSLFAARQGLRTVAFLRPDNLIALIIYNSNSVPREVDIQVLGHRPPFTVSIEANSINTVLLR